MTTVKQRGKEKVINMVTEAQHALLITLKKKARSEQRPSKIAILLDTFQRIEDTLISISVS